MARCVKGCGGLGREVRVRATMWVLLKEFLQFLRQEKKWWLAPLVVLLIAFGALLVFSSSSGIAWALYPFM